MNTDVVGVLFTFLNIQSFGGPHSQLKDLAVDVNTVSNLKQTIEKIPGITIEDFRKNGFVRSGNLGIYASKSVCEYMFKGNVNPNEEAVVLTLQYEPRVDPIQKDSENDAFHYLVRHEGLDEKAAKVMLQYAFDTAGRHKRSLLENF